VVTAQRNADADSDQESAFFADLAAARSSEGAKAVRAVKRKQRRKAMANDNHPVNPNAAGVDIGAREIYVAVPSDRDQEPVRAFETFTEDLHRLADWLSACRVTTVAMESTGVYWIPLYEVLETRGIQPCLIDARHMKNVPGRRTDWHECQWIQYLHSVGLLRSAFRPESDICAVRALMRHRSDLVQMASQHVQHMQKALTQMNLQIHHVISDLTGVTGFAIVDAILAGERRADELAQLRDFRIKADGETIRKSLVGHWRTEHLFTLKQSRQLYQTYQQQILDCDAEIQKLTGEFSPRVDPSDRPLPPQTKHNKMATSPKGKAIDPHHCFDMRREAYKLFGVDVTQIPGIATIALSLFAELGRDMSRWPTRHHFASWLALCTDNDISGGRVLWKANRKAKNRAGQLFRLAANSLHHSKTYLGNFLRRMKAKLGAPAGITATAHKIAIIFYTLVQRQIEYDETIWAQREAERQQHYEAKLKRQAQKLGYMLVPMQSAQSVPS
jgi:Transposase IS116/IS110/IS902 family./Transposase.